MILIILTIIAIMQQVAFVAYRFGAIFSKDHRSVGSYIFGLITSRQLSLWPFIELVIAQLLLYVVVTAGVYVIARLLGKLFKLRLATTNLIGVILWVIVAIFIVSANSYYFPHSNFAIHSYPLLIKTLMIVSAAFIISAIAIVVIAFKWLRIIAVLLVIFIALHHIRHPVLDTGSKDKPNVIIIGLDSIRPDYVKAGSNIAKFLASSANFTQAYSPLARTYVAWNSILSGKYPKHDGVRANLVDPDSLNLHNTLAAKLQRAGYETIFATDSRQFSLINKQFGFDHIVSPKMGIYDFIFSLFNDFPLSNLVMNSPVGEWLFPYNYANRMSYVTYTPQVFDNLLNDKLKNRTNKPLFLAIHLILTHWPFMWAHDHQANNASMAERYSDTVATIDKQLEDVLQKLKRNNLLKHAIVILLSDHGVSLGLHNDRVITMKNYIGNKNSTKILTRYAYNKSIRKNNTPYLGIDTANGEGNDALAFYSSNHIIFGIKSYGLSRKFNDTYHYPVTLMDIAPTILDILHLPHHHPTIFDVKHNRAIYFETGIWMPLFSIADLKRGDTSKYIVQNLKKLYSFNSKENLIVIKPATVKKLLASKQRAILYGNWFLARYPKAKNIVTTIMSDKNPATKKCNFITHETAQKDQIVCYTFTNAPKPFYVLVNTKTHNWTLDLESDFAKSSPFKLLQHKLKAFYGNEI